MDVLLLAGGAFILAGIIMHFFPPKKINSIYGYRTVRSMKNQNTWDFAQKYSAKLLLGIGAALQLASTIYYLFTIEGLAQLIINACLIIGAVVFVFVKTENTLKNI
ncbi:SdpI family protein [Oceanihabitans sediminis]|uniref:SdpI family protein n=1 Tax=Oceanihabitans sediminis TaxID=1812012 RepID=A0A368P416_9FLAO|nr:SdpI family protein [Oceanihabitans sediminis]MDX1278523.1 SdpI family protein [Oceanihabitans sediminis]MDX1774285.1 SdpI family protein [Oceanihabitans sediminis]RBP29913.1 SdpI/YhfL family protein [Oceanihabitans sediminis]RCU57248.1 hypothetical protein DU428_09920 [Oceanihabitans sediminis]